MSNYFMSEGCRPGLIHDLSKWLSVCVWDSVSCCYFCGFVGCNKNGMKFFAYCVYCIIDIFCFCFKSWKTCMIKVFNIHLM